MIRKLIFWTHLSLGVSAGLFIFIMAATGVVLAFERQITDFVDRDIRSVSAPNAMQRRPMGDLLQAVEQAGEGQPTAIVVRNAPQAATQFSIGRGKMIYIDAYSGAILGSSSAAAHSFFFGVERLHRAIGAPLGSKGLGHWLAAVSNLLFGGLILLGAILWVPRRWSWKAIRASVVFRAGLGGRARYWNWHNVLGIWCAAPLLVIVLTGVVMSFPWANALLFQLSGSTAPAQHAGPGKRRALGRETLTGQQPNYDKLLTVVKTFDPRWRAITLDVATDANSPVQATVDTGNGGQPQKRIQYLLNRNTGVVLKTTKFADSNLGQRLRAFVRFGHTGEWGGWPGQFIAALASLGACILVYTGLSLSMQRLLAKLKRDRSPRASATPTPNKLGLDLNPGEAYGKDVLAAKDASARPRTSFP